MKETQNKQAGFTLIELVVVIVLLGILAATALPKFLDLSKDARGGVMTGVEGAMRSANTMIYSKAAAAGLETTAAGATNKVTVNSTDVLLAFGYAKDATELAKVLTLSPVGDFDVTNAARIAHTKAPDYLLAAPAPENCAVAYTAATSATAPAQYATTTTGC